MRGKGGVSGIGTEGSESIAPGEDGWDESRAEAGAAVRCAPPLPDTGSARLLARPGSVPVWGCRKSALQGCNSG